MMILNDPFVRLFMKHCNQKVDFTELTGRWEDFKANDQLNNYLQITKQSEIFKNLSLKINLNKPMWVEVCRGLIAQIDLAKNHRKVFNSLLEAKRYPKVKFIRNGFDVFYTEENSTSYQLPQLIGKITEAQESNDNDIPC